MKKDKEVIKGPRKTGVRGDFGTVGGGGAV